MNVIIFSLTILAIYGIITLAYKAYKDADIKDKMREIEKVEEDYENIIKFKKVHKGNIKKKQKTIEKFKE